jgi:23S rRNA (adenine2503-C2)-methyltransferase
MDLLALENILRGEPKYRLKQAKRAVFIDLVGNWMEAVVLPVELRAKLNEACPLRVQIKTHLSKDGRTTKAVIALNDGLKIESVLMRYDEGRNTICLSSQVGCALGCNFCATGKMGFKRNLAVEEIVDQVLFWARWLKRGNDKITNVVFMGMGEPFLNYDNVMAAIHVLNDKDGLNLGARHFSVSTVGIIEGIKKLAEEPLQINLAISLHAPDDELRSKLMPVGKKYTIKKILTAVDKYIKKTNRKVMFEYIMIDGVNDGEKQARQLAKLMKKPLYFINLIPCNPVGKFRPSPQERIEKFKKILKSAGVQVNQRHSFGQDIKAACGQLVA